MNKFEFFSKRLYLTLVWFYISLNSSFAQIDPSSLDKFYLEHEIKTLIDSTRLAHQLPPLYNDSILYIASDHHAKYLLSKGALSHEESENKEFLTPQIRANYYGAPKSYFVGENIAYTIYNSSVKSKDKVFKTDNYKEIARSLVHSWINSKGHFANIIKPEYQVTGLAISIDTKLKRIYACQKFAVILYKYEFIENTAFFPFANTDSINSTVIKSYPKKTYPYKLRDDKVEQCESCKDAWNSYPLFSVRLDKGYFVLRVEEADFVKGLIQNKNDGFAIEIVSYDPFACGNPAYENEPGRRNNSLRTSGIILEPVYRNDLMKGYKKRKKVKNLNFVKYVFQADSVSFFKRFGRYKLAEFDAAYFELKLGKVPKDLSTWWNHNLMYINNKQICHFVFLTSYSGALSTEFVDVDYFPPVPFNNYQFEIEKYRDTLDLFYEVGKTESSGKSLEKLINHLKSKDLTIQKIVINGYSSVEGSEEINERLHNQRTNEIIDKLKIFTDNNTLITSSSSVAWEHFYKTVKNHPKWKFMFDMTQDEVLKYLANPKNEKPTEILNKERKVSIEIFTVKEINQKTASYYINRDLKTFFYEDRFNKLQYKNIEILTALYEKAYYFTTVDTLSEEAFLKIEIPKLPSISHRLEHDMAFYRYHLLKDKSDKTELLALHRSIEIAFEKCGAVEHLTPEFHYLSACLLAEKLKSSGNKLKAEDPLIQKALDRLNTLLNGYELDTNFYYNVAKANLNIINLISSTIGKNQISEYIDIVNSSLIQIVEYYRKTNQMNARLAERLANLSVYFENVRLAINLCSEYLEDHEILKLYLRLSYTHSSYLSNTAALEYEEKYHQQILQAKSTLNSEEWCGLFFGKDGIPFQIMDNKEIREQFCATCPDRVNEVLGE